MDLNEITPVLLTYNEAPNIGRTLARLSWASRIVIVDSGSTDDTKALATSRPAVYLEHREMDNHAAQWNCAVSLAKTEWVLLLDADYQVTAELVDELKELHTKGRTAFRCQIVYCIASHPIDCGIYPPVVALVKRDSARFEQDGHTQRMMEIKNIGALESPLLHDDRKPFKCWIRSQWRYAGLEALKLRKLRFSRARRTDRLRKLVMVMPVLIPLYILLVRGGVLDGWRGFRYAGERSLAEAMIGVRLLSSFFAASVG